MPIYPYSFTMPPVNKQDIPSDGVVGEFLGISAGGVLDWLPVATGGGDMLKADNLSGLADYSIARTNIGLGTASTPTFANLTLTSPSLSSDAPVTISQTWNGTGSTVFTALKVNATTPGTTSSFSSLLLDLQVGGATKTSVDKLGVISAFSYIGLNNIGSSVIQLGSNSASYGYHMARDYCVTWGGAATLNGSIEVSLCRDEAANTLALRNGAAAQTFNVYGTYTSGTSYERLTLSAPSAANAIIGTNKGSGGGTARGLDLHTDGAARMTISTAGNVGIGTTNPTTPLSIQASSAGNVLNVIGVGSFGNFLFQVGGIYGVNLLSQSNTSTDGFILGTDGGASNAGAMLRLQTKGTTRAVIDYLGNVGIGTTTPGAKLQVEVADNTVLTPALMGNSGDNGTAIARVYNLSETVGSYSGIRLATRSSQAKLWGIYNVSTGSGAGDLVFGGGSVGVGSEAMRILNNGNVGIGTTAPGAKLEVVENTSNVAALIVRSSSAAAPRIEFIDGAVTPNRWTSGIGATSTTDGLFTLYDARLQAVRLVINASGNVGIGTTSPTSKLHVAGSSSPSITVDNTLATGASQLLFKNTVVTGDTDGIFLNGSAQSGFGGNGSLNIKATTGPLAFHTNTVTNALSIAQNGAAAFANNIFLDGFIQLYNSDGRIYFDGGNRKFFTAANTYIQDLYRRAGSGDPNGTVTAPVGATYNRTDGGAGTSFYVKESGTGNTGWVGK